MPNEEMGIPTTPKVISPSPAPGDQLDAGSYFPPTTRSAAKRAAHSSRSPDGHGLLDSDSDSRARARSRSPTGSRRRRKSDLSSLNSKAETLLNGSNKPSTSNGRLQKSKPIASNGHAPSGTHLSPSSAASSGSSYWRDISRSPSPLGLIPLHQSWRSFIHRHEIPRKALHVSIGFVTLRLYSLGLQQSAIHPWLLGALIPIASIDVARHHWEGLNQAYVKVCGALMRESEVNDRYNGVIWYLLGTWIAMRFMPKDVGVMSILLLSWCDTAASTVGRRWGRYTPRVRQGKSLAGTAAACVVGVATSWLFWGWIAPTHFGLEDNFAFQGRLTMPRIPGLMAVNTMKPVVKGWLAMGIMSFWSGIVASVSEAVDIFGLDDNITIPVLSGLGLWGFLKVFA